MSDRRNTQPFIGLRTFTRDDDALFYGRDRLIDGLLERLAETRFVAVLGRSGAGKSSLVRAGLIPALEAGYLDWDGADWDIVTMRPGGNPITELSEELAKSRWGKHFTRSVPAGEAAPFIAKHIRASRLGLTHAVGMSPEPEGSRLLLIVDQFEETFRYGRDRAASGRRVTEQVERTSADLRDTKLFIDLLTESAVGLAPIYIILTMRSDFLGECGEHPALSDAVNRGVFLVSNMTDNELIEAIELPASYVGGKVDRSLVSALLDEVEGQQYQLPMLQHVLMRLWARLPAGGSRTLTVPMLRELGDSKAVLGGHLSEIYEDLSEDQKRVAEKLFKCITKIVDEKNVRDPAPLRVIADETQEGGDVIRSVIERFRAPGCSFISPLPTGPQDTLDDDDIIDITHEAVIHSWGQLKKWIVEEDEGARHYMELCKLAEKERYEGLMRDSADLREKAAWRDAAKPTAEWARRYGGNFVEAMSFLERSQDARDRSTLRESIQAGKFDVTGPENIEKLIERGVRLTQKDLDGWPFAPHYLALVPDQVVKLLRPETSDEASLESSDQLTLTEDDFRKAFPPQSLRRKALGGLSVAHFAAQGGDQEILEYLKRSGVNFLEPNERNTLPFAYGCNRETTSAIEWIYKQHPSVEMINHQNENGWFALGVAVEESRLEIVKWLIDHGANVNAVQRRGNSALHVAMYDRDRSRVAALLIAHNGDPNLKNEMGRTPVYVAAEERNLEGLRELFRGPAQVDIRDNDGATPLIAALKSWGMGSLLPVLELLVDKGADVNAVYERTGDTPLHLALDRLAAWEGLDRVVNFLVSRGAHVDSVNRDNATPIGLALSRGHEHLAIAMLDKRRNQDRTTGWLLSAAAADAVDFLKRLLDSGVNVNERYKWGDETEMTALHVAAAAGSTRAVELLLARGAERESANADGVTPLRGALEEGKWQTARQLVKAGARMPKWLKLDPESTGAELTAESVETIRAGLCAQLRAGSEVEWPHEPLIRGAWSLLDVNDAAAALAPVYQDPNFLLRQVSEHIDALRVLPAPFLADGKLYEARVAPGGVVRGYYTFVSHAGGITPIDGQKSALEAAAGSLRVPTQELASQYLRFMCSAVEYDRYYLALIESAEDAFREGNLTVSDQARASVAAGAAAVTFDSATPMAGEKPWSGNCVVQYGGSLWPARFSINTTGAVDLRGEGSLGENLPCPEIRFVDGVRSVSERKEAS